MAEEDERSDIKQDGNGGNGGYAQSPAVICKIKQNNNNKEIELDPTHSQHSQHGQYIKDSAHPKTHISYNEGKKNKKITDIESMAHNHNQEDNQ